MASGCGAANIAAHFVLADSGCFAPFAYLLLLRFGNIVAGSRGRTICCSSKFESADACGVGLAVVSGDVVESVNYILKKGYNGHSAGGGGAGKSAVKREAMVVQQVWEWWFLTFDLPLLYYN